MRLERTHLAPLKAAVAAAALLYLSACALVAPSGTRYATHSNITYAAYLQGAAEQGDADAQWNLGFLYEQGPGYGVAKDEAKAAFWYRKAAEKDNFAAQSRLAELYSEGRGVTQDFGKANFWIDKTREQNDAILSKTFSMMQQEETSDADRAFNQAVAASFDKIEAAQGNADMQYNLGIRYTGGLGVAKDDAKALFWFKKAAGGGQPQAQFNVGLAYAIGEGVARDDAKAAFWYRKAADQGNAKAQHNLGVLYAEGLGVAQNHGAAAFFFRNAASQGIADAQFNLGMLYAAGQGVPQDIAKAISWLRKAAEQGDPQARQALGALINALGR